MEPKALSLPVPLATAIANYLAERPYKEVAQLLAALGQLQPVQEATKDGKSS